MKFDIPLNKESKPKQSQKAEAQYTENQNLTKPSTTAPMLTQIVRNNQGLIKNHDQREGSITTHKERTFGKIKLKKVNFTNYKKKISQVTSPNWMTKFMQVQNLSVRKLISY